MASARSTSFYLTNAAGRKLTADEIAALRGALLEARRVSERPTRAA